MARRVAAVATAAALLGTAPAWAGATQLYSSTSFLLPASLAGDSVLVGQQRTGGAARLLWAPAAGGPVRSVFDARPGRSGRVLLSYAGTPSRVVVRRTLGDGPGAIFAGPPAGPLVNVEDCPQSTDFAPGPVADGNVAAWAGAQCVPELIRIRDGVTSRIVEAGGSVNAIAAAGRFVAWLAVVPSADPSTPPGTRLVVHDTSTGTSAYTAEAPPSLDLDVQADGTAVVGTFTRESGGCGGGPRARFVYYTAAEPVAHEVPGARACEAGVRIAGGRIAFVAPAGTGGRMLTLTDLAGTTRQDVARLDMFPPQVSFDYDGRRVAWSQTRCRDHALFVRDATDPSAPDPAVACPVVVGTPRLARDGTVHVHVRCPSGCRSLSGQGMTFVAPRWLHVWKRTRTTTRYAPYRPIDVRPGRAVTLKLPTTAYQRAVIRRRGRVPVRLKVLAQNVYLPRIARTLRAR